ncbi:helix-turn-helix domain-containing protein [Candidatus Latescibacterota bacterium]
MLKETTFSYHDDVIFGVDELSKYLLVTKKWIYERTCRNEIPHYKIRDSLRFKKTEIDNWFNKQRVPFVEKECTL